MKILGYISGFDGCGLFRMQIPFKYLSQKDNVFTKISFKYSEDEIRWADIIILQKQCRDDVLPYLNFAKKLNKPVVLEFDDLMTEIPEWNAAHDFYKTKVDKVINFIKNADACTVSTNFLKEVNLPINPNIYVLPNSMDMDELEKQKFKSPESFLRQLVFKDPEHLHSRHRIQYILPQQDTLNRLRDKTKIMWWGSPTHKEDLKIIEKTLAKIAKEHPEIIVLSMGCCTENLLKEFSSIYKQLILVDPVQTSHFHGALNYLGRLSPTIVTAPIVNIPFNRGKSNLKVVEGFAIKGAVVASNVENYTKTITHGVNGFLANDTKDSNGIAVEWYDYIKQLIDNPMLHSFIAENGYNTVLRDYNISDNVNLWYDAYKQILEKRK